MLDLKNVNITFPEGFCRQSLALLSRLVASVERLTVAVEVRNPVSLPDIMGAPIKPATYFVRDDANLSALEYAENHRRLRTEEGYSPNDDLDIEELESLAKAGDLEDLGSLGEVEGRY